MALAHNSAFVGSAFRCLHVGDSGADRSRLLLAALRPSTKIPIADIALRVLLDVAVAAPSSPPKTCARQMAGSSGQCAGRITRPLGRSCVIRLRAVSASAGDTGMPASSRTLAVHTLQVLNRWNFSRDA